MERFDQLFSLYHSFPLENNPHIHPNRNTPRLPFCTSSSQIRLHTRKFDGNDPAGLYSIGEYFDYYDTPPIKRRCLVELCMEGQAAKWFRWMQTNVLLPNKIPPLVLNHPQSMHGRPSCKVVHSSHKKRRRLVELCMEGQAAKWLLGAEQMLRSAHAVCTTWWKVSKNPVLWQVIDFSNPRQSLFNDEYNAMCGCAVDRSQGQLVDLTIQYFGEDTLMDYIADRSPNLKRLKLGTCFFISGVCAIRMVAKLKQLEELLIAPYYIAAYHIADIGNSCPLLKSFSFNGFKCKLLTYEDNDHNDRLRKAYALVISKSMSNLRHLQVFAHWMGNKGLKLIFDGCPHLESLDIRQCFDLDLQGDLGKRCRQQIKYLKLPNDSVSDVPWPNCDGGDPFGTSAFKVEYHEYDYYKALQQLQ
ncbi:hypothetical protein SASPL_124016 [Salvia splendens]|uniref:F-box and leucine-rich repeat protein 2/20 n=1 Tax=Salvia splendens TaxID=180675 RepID=A0A8X8XRD9_SALSN|nr:hypothetical protein SASPL_124016 [Salvia splendens]